MLAVRGLHLRSALTPARQRVRARAMASASTGYKELASRLRDINYLGGISGLLGVRSPPHDLRLSLTPS